MTKFRWQSIVQWEYDSDTDRTKMVKAFTTPIGATAQNRQRGKTKFNFKGSSTESEEVIL